MVLKYFRKLFRTEEGFDERRDVDYTLVNALCGTAFGMMSEFPSETDGVVLIKRTGDGFMFTKTTINGITTRYEREE